MKQLFLMRHAKSDWHTDAQHDKDRPLNKSGQLAADEMGERLAALDFGIEETHHSYAKRTTDTAFRLNKSLKLAIEQIHSYESIYHDGITTIKQIIEDQKEETESILIIGHNPDLDYLLNQYANCDYNMVTAAIAGFKLPSWQELASAELFYFDIPKNESGKPLIKKNE